MSVSLGCLHSKLANTTCLPGTELCIRLFACPLLRSPWESPAAPEDKCRRKCPGLPWTCSHCSGQLLSTERLQPTLGGSCSPWRACSPRWWLTSPSCQGQAFGCACGAGRVHGNIDCDQVESLVFKITLSASSITSHSSQPSKCWFLLLNKQCLIFFFYIGFFFSCSSFLLDFTSRCAWPFSLVYWDIEFLPCEKPHHFSHEFSPFSLSSPPPYHSDQLSSFISLHSSLPHLPISIYPDWTGLARAGCDHRSSCAKRSCQR